MKPEEAKKAMALVDKIEELQRMKSDWEVCDERKENVLTGLSMKGHVELYLDAIPFSLMKRISLSYCEEQITKLTNELEEM